jgi:hypothetical protein
MLAGPGRLTRLLSVWPTLLLGFGVLASILWTFILAWTAFDALSSVASVLADHMIFPEEHGASIEALSSKTGSAGNAVSPTKSTALQQ